MRIIDFKFIGNIDEQIYRFVFICLSIVKQIFYLLINLFLNCQIFNYEHKIKYE
jgi:hypothetical protein